MSTPAELRPYVMFTLEEGDELDTLIKKNFALVDLLNCIYSGPTDGPDPDSMEWISAMIFDNASEIKKLWDKGSDRESEARGVKAPETPAQEAHVETDPLGKGRSLIALLRGNYDFLNSVISKSPEIKKQLRELQGEAADLLEKFDDLLIDLDELGEPQAQA